MDHLRSGDMDEDPFCRTSDELIKDMDAIKERISEIKCLADEYKKSKDALKLDEARLETLLRLNDMYNASERDIIDFSLEEAIRLTGSSIGWIGVLSGDERVIASYYWSNSTVRDCEIRGRSHSFHVSDGGVWAEPVVRRIPVVINDFPGWEIQKKGFPGDHIPLERFLGVPIYDGVHIVAVAEVGNKGTDYDNSDLRQLTLLMSSVWRIIMRKRAETDVRESKSQSDLYVDLMSHDINNMNQVAIGFIELALDHLELDGSLRDQDRNLLEKPIDALKNSAKLIDNVKKLQRIRKGSLTTAPVDAGKALDDAVEEFSSTKNRDIHISYTPLNGANVTANELLKDVYSNILGNSVRHSSPDKPLFICIGANRKMLDGKEYFVVSIDDNGPGICDERKVSVFDRFDLYKNNQLSSGLGLGLVKELVDLFGGRAWIEDRIPGDHTQGCRCIVALPMTGGL
jgi:signal transduction histidine kinase